MGSHRYYLRNNQGHCPEVVRALKPGGAVVVEYRHMGTKRFWPTGTFASNEWLSLFPGLRVLRYEDVWARPDSSLN